MQPGHLHSENFEWKLISFRQPTFRDDVIRLQSEGWILKTWTSYTFGYKGHMWAARPRATQGLSAPPTCPEKDVKAKFEWQVLGLDGDFELLQKEGWILGDELPIRASGWNIWAARERNGCE